MANIIQNRVSTTLTTTEVTNITTHQTAISAITNAKTVSLTPDELNSLPSIDVSNYVFVQDAVNVADAEGVAMLPPAIAAQVPEMVKDFTYYDQIDVLKSWYQDQINRLTHTQRIVASESYRVANVMLGQYEILADAGVPGAAVRRDKLKARYKDNGGGRPSTNPIS